MAAGAETVREYMPPTEVPLFFSRGTKPTNRQSCLANTCPFKIVLSWREAIVVAADCNNCCCPSEGSWGLTHQFAQKRVHIHADSPKVRV